VPALSFWPPALARARSRLPPGGRRYQRSRLTTRISKRDVTAARAQARTAGLGPATRDGRSPIGNRKSVGGPRGRCALAGPRRARKSVGGPRGRCALAGPRRARSPPRTPNPESDRRMTFSVFRHVFVAISGFCPRAHRCPRVHDLQLPERTLRFQGHLPASTLLGA
jgi:hypothetical protein